MDIHAQHDDAYAALPKFLRLELVDFLRHNVSVQFFASMRVGWLIFKKDWFLQEDFHRKDGLNLRNLLRSSGYTDFDLPSGNWDDVYVPVLEAAAGLRPVLLPSEVDEQSV